MLHGNFFNPRFHLIIPKELLSLALGSRIVERVPFSVIRVLQEGIRLFFLHLVVEAIGLRNLLCVSVSGALGRLDLP